MTAVVIAYEFYKTSYTCDSHSAISRLRACARGKVISCIVWCCSCYEHIKWHFWRSRNLSDAYVCKHDQSKLAKKLASVCFKSRDTLHSITDSPFLLAIAHRSYAYPQCLLNVDHVLPARAHSYMYVHV